MATLTPGVLQVIDVLPGSLYIQLSDSLNSTYVSLSDGRHPLQPPLQIGQLDRLHFSHPVPRASGLRPVPSDRHPHPFAGSPVPLVAARSSPWRDGFVIQPASPSSSGPPLISNHSHLSESGITKVIFQAKENVSNVANSTNPPSKWRFSSRGGAKLASRKRAYRDPSPGNKLASRASSPALSKSGSGSWSPVPSMCAVPGLVAAKEENRRVAREPAIIFPSRFRQPWPVEGRRGAGSPVTRRSSGSPGRRLLGGMKVLPAAGEGSKKRIAQAILRTQVKTEGGLNASASFVAKANPLNRAPHKRKSELHHALCNMLSSILAPLAEGGKTSWPPLSVDPALALWYEAVARIRGKLMHWMDQQSKHIGVSNS